MIDKALVKKRFSRNLETYKDNSVVQNKMADRLVGMINFCPENVLELGCGTGLLTEKLVKTFQFKIYDTVDIVSECETYINKISDKINFYQSDIETYDFKGQYDLIISNAVFQWIEDMPKFINKLKNCLKPNGILLFSTFGTENLREISKLTGYSLDYKSVEELNSSIYPYTIDEEKLVMNFENPKAVLKHLKYTGVNAISKQHWTKSDLIEFEKKYYELCPTGIVLTYHPIYVKLLSEL